MRSRLLDEKILWLFLFALALKTPLARAQDPADRDVGQARTVLKTTVRRVVLDVVVTDSRGAPVPGLSEKDFVVKEDGEGQRILSFDANGFTPEMDYLPPSLPGQPANTFINLPATPEKGPLYVLLYDMVDMDDPAQMDTPEDHHIQVIARQQMVKFIQSKPEGARFAVFVRSDGLHLVQGFTSDKSQLLAAIDPRNPRPHMPKVFLMAPNYGRGDHLGILDALHRIALYLDGMPGRKNLIWFSGMFPLSLFPEETDGPNLWEKTKATLDLLAHDQIAVYPVDARGVPWSDSHTYVGTSVHNAETSGTQATGAGSAVGAGGVGSSPTSGSSQGGAGQGDSAVVGSYNVMDGIAKETGGRAFYGTNDVADELVAATQSGGVYYTLTYAPKNAVYDGKLRSIRVELAKKGYQLSYRRSYYGTTMPEESGDLVSVATANGSTPGTGQRAIGDTLLANMQHGAPTAHALVFVVQAHAGGLPVQGSPEQMAELATEPAYFKSRRKSAPVKALAPILLQKDVFSFEVPTRQFKGETTLDLEVALAAYDADGRMMNGIVRVAKKGREGAEGASEGEGPRFFRVEQELAVPVGAATLRFAVRDTMNDRIGAMEIALPLAAENTSAGTGSVAAH